MMLEWSWPVCAITFFLLDEWVLISIKYLAQHFKMMRNVNPPKRSNEQCCMLYVLLDVLAKILFRITRPAKATVSSIINDVQSLRGFHQLAYIAKVSDTWIKFIIITIIIIIITITMATIPGRLYRITFAPARWTILYMASVHTQVISARFLLWKEAAPRRSLKLRVTYLMGVNTLELFVSARKAIRHSVNITWRRVWPSG